MKRWEVEGWKEADVDQLELSFLHQVLAVGSARAVDATLTFAKYLEEVGVNSDTYPIYLKLLETPNHWVIDALIGDRDPEKYFAHIQMNYYIVNACFRALEKAKSGSVYPKCLLVYLGILEVTYENPVEGYQVYPVSSNDINQLGKHLDESQDQMNPLNRSLLYLLDKIASLLDPGNMVEDQKILQVAVQANNIRGKFLDATKNLRESIPDLLLERGDYTDNEVQPGVAV
ncbi:MAG: hypothetical protein ACOC8L_01875 [Spirochaetota bacterium]